MMVNSNNKITNFDGGDDVNDGVKEWYDYTYAYF